MTPKELQKTEAPSAGLVPYDYGTDAGAGYDHTDESHYLVPRIDILQPLSPEVTEVEGAKPGMFYNSANGTLFDGKTGFVFVPVDTKHVYTEWVPKTQGGGFRGTHEVDSPAIVEALAAGGRAFGNLALPSVSITGQDGRTVTESREAQETFVLLGMILGSADATAASEFVSINFKSTQIKKYKALLYRLRSVQVPGPDGRPTSPPLFANRVLFRTVPEKNAKGNWFGFDLAPAVGKSPKESLIPSGHPLLAEGRAWLDRVRSGAAKASFEGSAPVAEEDGGGHF